MIKLVSNSGSERHLLDFLDRISRNPSGYAVLYVSISKLKPKNRHPQFVKIMAKFFDSVAGANGGAFFVLSNGDFVLIGKDVRQLSVDEAVHKLREGLSSDPILHTKDSSEFASVYEFPAKFSFFYHYIQDLKIIHSQPTVNAEDNLRAIEPLEINDVISGIEKIDIADIIKRQSVMKIRSTDKFEVLFQEFFVAVKDLAKQFDNGVDFTKNQWLFMYMTQALDKKTLSAFATSDLHNWPKEVSINLNLSSVFSKEFGDFIKSLPEEHKKVIVEIKLMDVFTNLELYFEVKKFLHDAGHKILIDEMNPAVLKMLDIKKLAPDMIKIFWEPLLEYENDEALIELINNVGRQNTILAKCDSDKALKWGAAHGISAFQGPVMDSIEINIIKQKCPDAEKCAFNDCLKRRKLLQGGFRNECRHKEILEELL